jgi:hypothetical protein
MAARAARGFRQKAYLFVLSNRSNGASGAFGQDADAHLIEKTHHFSP